MKTISPIELKEILRLHQLWAEGDVSGKRANLSNTDLSDIDLRGINLSDADLRGADLRGINLNSANLSYTELRGSDLTGANLGGAYLNGTHLNGTNISDVNLRQVTGNSEKIRTIRLKDWSVVITKDLIAIGCQQHSPDQWNNFTDSKIQSMSPIALEFWKEWKEFIFKVHNSLIPTGV